MTLKVSCGLINRPQKVVIYGPEGIGKTTLASDFPSPLFFDTEGGTAHMKVCRAEWGDTWNDLIRSVKEVSRSQDLCETLIIDTADWAEQLCIQKVCDDKKIEGIEDIGYGKGYTYVGEEFARLLKALDDVIKNGIHVVVTAHAKMRKFEQPDELGAYDRWEMKLSRQAAPLLKEWADMILFCNYKTTVVTTKEKTKKAQGGKRVMYTSHHPCWDAKNRHGLKEVLDMDYSQIRDAIEGASRDTRPEPDTIKPEPAQVPPMPEPVQKAKDRAESQKEPGTPLQELISRAKEAGIDLGDIQKACIKKKLQPNEKFVEEYDPEFIQGMLLDKWDGFVRFIKKNKEKESK